MSLSLCSINSGSNGNCYYIGSSNEAVLIDAGISCKEIEKRLSRKGLAIEQVKALFISHEHIDHIRGAEVLSRKHNIPVYINSKTHISSRLRIEPKLLREIKTNETLNIGALSIKAFGKQHDAADPISFNVSGFGLHIGVYTDIGTVCENLLEHFKLCNAVFLESNYDDDLLENGSYPFHLKQRIKSNTGHLSNKQALDLVVSHKAPHLSHLILSHLSKENNHPQLVEALFKQVANEVSIVVASRHCESEVFHIGLQTSSLEQKGEVTLSGSEQKRPSNKKAPAFKVENQFKLF